jgi:hypothetical protein
VRASGSQTGQTATKGPMWGYPRPVLGAVDPFLEPFRGRLSPNIDNVSEKLTLRYPHEGPWVAPPKHRRKLRSQRDEGAARPSLSCGVDASTARCNPHNAGPRLRADLFERHLAWCSQTAVGQRSRQSGPGFLPAAPTAGQCARQHWEVRLAVGISQHHFMGRLAFAVPQDPRGGRRSGADRG